MRRAGRMATLIAGTFAASASLAADKAPGWLGELATSELPAYEAKVPAAVLVNEETVTLEAGGKQTRTLRYAVKILNREGAREAAQSVVYYTDTGRVREIKGWMISATGQVKELGKSDTVDGAVGKGLFEQVRFRSIDASSQADPGAVFGFESTIEETSVFTQFIYDFQDDLPALRSGFTLNLPPGWRAEGQVFRGLEAAPAEPQVSGSTFHWQMRALPPFEREPGAPRRSTLTPRLVVSTFPASGTANGHFATWSDVSGWVSQFTDPAAAVTPELERRAAQLTSNASSQWDKIRALAEEAQHIRYESIQLNLSRGGGYTPHAAATVMSNGYGDCKDKATYLRALLKSIGVESYPVVIYSGDPRRTRAEWPSPMQFNHAILAIRLSEDAEAPSMFEFPGLGKMILFDPTDDSVPFGYLPDHEQESNALLLAGERGDLFRTPSTAPEVNRIERVERGSVSPSGELQIRITQTATGQEAFDERSYWSQLSPSDYVRFWERRLSRSQTAVRMGEVTPKDDPENRQFVLDLNFGVLAYARVMQGRLMMFQPAVLGFGRVPDLAKPERTQPLIVSPASFHERVELGLPAGFAVDEMPVSFETASDFGDYEVSYETHDGRVVMERRLELRSAWIPATEFTAAREFFGAIGASESAPVVLVRQ